MRRRRLSTASSSSKRLGSSSTLRSKALNTPHHTRRFTTLISDQEPDTTYLWGYLLFFSTMIGFTTSMYALVASNYMPMTGNKTLDWIKQDSHYCMLLPVTIPVTVLAVLFNWLGMKLFRHN
ncbi:phosphatidylinositol N-acetylglucosaminyltransferase subunit Y-domain-containing protein [Lobosporangium transversale]|uniref:Phosphatidylinositol N-acetylglucosaminyltransferase subunit Y-domain-containing protein n=1 Tax=Lobosporangium transversale TaxID=64571 RepID=A0A1Y2GU76_9FUNG|nr:phosphatidylinositol N-acetylglucosaminyltransferase subunit Y-domain-containing protein [Lobosporangium transversale]ORZ23799.1 phosphatidylinositol N-acetylglucosaminyltransferase subunit Y-domain-containing protein [Lobosporangium transversale]|eukprot:XP_021883613.1 phosphatidylinositol N-acetylglucosaminyltransferase subunit Y-domain-containing protein [Lobosporangium transversale]